MKKRAILAWEHGGGRGHIAMLRDIAAALQDDYAFEAVLYQMDHAAELEPVCTSVKSGAGLIYDPAPASETNGLVSATWGDYLADSGFRDVEFLQSRIMWWYLFLSGREPSLLIADHAPISLIAARILGIPVAVSGIGFFVPPPGVTRFPINLPGHATSRYDEAEILARLNEAAVPFGMEPLQYLPELYHGGRQLVSTLPMLDFYGDMRQTPLLPPCVDVPLVAGSEGRNEVFAYLSTTEGNDAGVIEALGSLDVPVRAYMPGINAETTARLAARGVVVERQALSLAAIVSRSRMIFMAGQHGTLCAALTAGLPQVCVPQQREQAFNSRRAAAAGGTKVLESEERSAAQVRAAILDCYHDEGMARAALALAADLPRHTAADMNAAIRAQMSGISAGGG